MSQLRFEEWGLTWGFEPVGLVLGDRYHSKRQSVAARFDQFDDLAVSGALYVHIIPEIKFGCINSKETLRLGVPP